jgi:hypothetical protein
MTSFVFAESSGLSSGALTAGSYATDTDVAGVQTHAAVHPVCGPGGDPFSASLTASVKSTMSQVGSQLHDGAQLQRFYAEAIAHASKTYPEVDELGSAAVRQATPGGTPV